MDIRDALTLANTLMAQHGLTTLGWRVALSSASTRHGSCSYSTRTIRLSRESIALRDEASVRGTILHEIAHALLADRRRFIKPHGPEWKALVTSIGGTPKASSPMNEAEASKPVALIAVGTRIRSTGGHTVTGVVMKRGRTRYHVQGDDGRLWAVPFQIAVAA